MQCPLFSMQKILWDNSLEFKWLRSGFVEYFNKHGGVYNSLSSLPTIVVTILVCVFQSEDFTIVFTSVDLSVLLKSVDFPPLEGVRFEPMTI